MVDFKVIENFLDKDQFLNLQSIFLSDNFPWFYHDNISGLNDSALGDFGFGHSIFYREPSSSIYSTVESVVQLICAASETTNIIKVRADMTVFSTYGHRHQPHLDLHEPHTVSILYLTNSDAETVIFKNVNIDTLSFDEYQRVAPKENKLVIFNGAYYHTGHSPASSNRRILLNVNSI